MPPTLPDQTQRNLKESPRLLPCWAYVIGLGVIEKYKMQGNLCPIFSAYFFQILSPPPPHMDSAVFLNIGLTQTCIAIDVPPPPPTPPPPPPPHWNLTNAPRGRQENAKQIVWNKVFECTTLLKIEVIEYGKWVSKWLGQSPSNTLPMTLLAPSVQAFGFQCPHPCVNNSSGSSPFCTYIRCF